MNYVFTVDDNIIFLKDLTLVHHASVFDHPYLAVYKRLHDKYGLKVQLNLFYRDQSGEFNLSMMSDEYKSEWEENSDWLKFSFHSEYENVRPYENSPYCEVYSDMEKVNSEILRFAGEKSLGKTTTIHYCQTTQDGVTAVKDNGAIGLLGLFGTSEKPIISYSLNQADASRVRDGEIVLIDGISFGAIDLIINTKSLEDNLKFVSENLGKNPLKLMIHEQYFYPEYFAYQPDFEQKLDTVFSLLHKNGYSSLFFEQIL